MVVTTIDYERVELSEVHDTIDIHFKRLNHTHDAIEEDDEQIEHELRSRKTSTHVFQRRNLLQGLRKLAKSLWA